MKASAPGQIFLFGEHAVVYGQPALATAIDIRTTVEAEMMEDNELVVKSEGVGELTGEIKNLNDRHSVTNQTGDQEELRFVTKVVELALDEIEKTGGIKLDIKSGLPTGSGLGSSSAVNTATAAAISSLFGDKLTRKKVAQIAFDAEKKVQGAASITGVTVASYGGFIKIQGKEKENLEDLSELDIVIGYTGKYGDTGKLVREVRILRQERPEIIRPILEAIGKCTEEGIDALVQNDLRKVEMLINANQNLLEGLGVSSPELRELIDAARENGAPGAKITGGGDGGCMIALRPKENGRIAEAIKEAGGEPIKAKIGVEGLKY